MRDRRLEIGARYVLVVSQHEFDLRLYVFKKLYIIYSYKRGLQARSNSALLRLMMYSLHHSPATHRLKILRTTASTIPNAKPTAMGQVRSRPLEMPVTVLL
jgi:hypothetical protein